MFQIQDGNPLFYNGKIAGMLFYSRFLDKNNYQRSLFKTIKCDDFWFN